MRTAPVLLSLLWSLSAFADDDVTRVNSSITAPAGEAPRRLETVNGAISVENGARAGDVETVNGSITIGSDAVVQRVETVNGRITLGSGAQAHSLETVNGSMQLAENASVQGDVTAVNGGLQLAPNASVGGDVENVNGRIELDRARVAGALRTTGGDITVGRDSRVGGGLEVEKSSRWFGRSARTPRIVIGPGAVIEGSLRFEREVELYVSDRAQIGAVEGAEVIRFSGDQPPGAG